VLGRFAGWGGVLKLRTERRSVLAELARFDVRPRQPDLSLALMSGGNQQKVLLAKWLLAGPRVLALHEPTQGVDIGAKRDVFAHLAALAGRGTTVLVSSVEYEDLAHLCDRVHVVAGGRVAATLSGSALTAHQLAAAVYA
jgi:ribose transport system ATP-binding protein